jgi:hypothetical protein
MSRIAIDVDGVLADFNAGFVEQINQLWPGRIPPAYIPPNYDKWVDLSKKEQQKVWRSLHSMDGFWLSLNALEGVGDLARWLASRTDHDLWLCTARKDMGRMTAAKETDLWVQACGLRAVNNFLGIITVHDADEKANVYQSMGIEWSLDDRTPTVIACGLIDTFEHRAYLLDQPWNEGAPVQRRVKSVAAFLEKIG